MPANLDREGLVPLREADVMVKDAFAVLEQAKRDADSGVGTVEEIANGHNGSASDTDKPPLVPAEQIIALNEEMLTLAQTFYTPNPKLARIVQRRATTLGEEGGIDWGQAEALAFASLLTEGISISLNRSGCGARHVQPSQCCAP